MKNLLLSLAVLASLTLTQSAFAEEPCPDCKGAADSHDSSSMHREHFYRWAFSFSPRYYGLNSSGYSSAFTGAGLSAPPSGQVGVNFSLYGTFESGWQLGLGWDSVGFSTSNGSTQASYSASLFGVWLGKEFKLCEDMDLAIGSLFAYGSAQNQVITTGVSGQTNESSFTLEPKIIVTHQIARWMKIGISGSYIEPVGQSQSILGNTLTTGHISLHGLSGGVEFVFGRFGQHTS